MTVYLDANLLNACKTLFGPETSISPEFLNSLNPRTLKTIFRKRAKETHPDLFAHIDPAAQKRQAELFRVVNEAYEIMRKYCDSRDRMQRRQSIPLHRSKAATTPTFRMDEHGWRYRGVVPERRLEIGRYLYYRGFIPYHALLRALAWQMRQRPPLGAIAKDWGWLDEQSIKKILNSRSKQRLFGQRALELGILSSYQARLLVAYQRTLQKKLGKYFVEHGYVTQEEMEQLAKDLQRHNARFPFSPVVDWRRS